MEIILASSSPRRKEILENINIEFKIIKSDIEEIILKDEKPISVVTRLSFEKCFDIAKNNPESTIIAADTIVALDNTILGKPKDKIDAYNMLKSLSNKNHQVITGMCVINLKKNKKVVDYVVSNVKFKKLSDDTIKNYIETNEPLDKAGAYGIQGYGALLVDKIDGDYFNIVGLPISRLSEILKSNFEINIL